MNRMVRDNGRRSPRRRAATTAAALLALAPAAFMVLGPGCGSGTSKNPEDACTLACNNNATLGCDKTCDCSKCAQLPASCTSADFDCPEKATTCTGMTTCPAPAAADCATFIGTFCQ